MVEVTIDGGAAAVVNNEIQFNPEVILATVQQRLQHSDPQAFDVLMWLWERAYAAEQKLTALFDVVEDAMKEDG
jgi:hypothetical protein